MGIPYRAKLAQIIMAGNGVVEDDLFVLKPGVLLMNVTETTSEAAALLDRLGLDADLRGNARVAAFDARLTYANFPDDDARSGEAYLRSVVEGRGHTSVAARAYASILFAGISMEDSIEFVAGRNGRSARLTSSDTKAQDDPLYCVRGSHWERIAQKAFVSRVTRLRSASSAESFGGRYVRNMLNLGNRATLLHMGMCMEDWHGIFRGRLPAQGNEPAVRDAFARACELLHPRFPYLIRTPADYGYTETPA